MDNDNVHISTPLEFCYEECARGLGRLQKNSSCVNGQTYRYRDTDGQTEVTKYIC